MDRWQPPLPGEAFCLSVQGWVSTMLLAQGAVPKHTRLGLRPSGGLGVPAARPPGCAGWDCEGAEGSGGGGFPGAEAAGPRPQGGWTTGGQRLSSVPSPWDRIESSVIAKPVSCPLMLAHAISIVSK